MLARSDYSNGATSGDFNGDGIDDVFVANSGGGRRNALARTVVVTQARDSRTPCAPGSVSSGGGQCTVCNDVGRRTNDVQTACEGCSAGTEKLKGRKAISAGAIGSLA